VPEVEVLDVVPLVVVVTNVPNFVVLKVLDPSVLVAATVFVGDVVVKVVVPEVDLLVVVVMSVVVKVVVVVDVRIEVEACGPRFSASIELAGSSGREEARA